MLSSRVQELHLLLSIHLAESLGVTRSLRVKQHGINFQTTAFIFSSVLEKPVWLMLVMTQQNLSSAEMLHGAETEAELIHYKRCRLGNEIRQMKDLLGFLLSGFVDFDLNA